MGRSGNSIHLYLEEGSLLLANLSDIAVTNDKNDEIVYGLYGAPDEERKIIKDE